MWVRLGPNAEFSVELPIANSSRFVFPTMTAPASCSRSTTVALYGGQPTVEDLGRTRGGHAPGAEVVLQSDRNAGERAGIAPAATSASISSARARAWSAVTWLNA